jgi:hypothetical protein
MEFTLEQATDIITKAVAEFKGSFTPEIDQKIENLKSELLGNIKGTITQENLDASIQALELKMDQFAEKMRPVETKSIVERFTEELQPAIDQIKAGKQADKIEIKAISSAELVAPKFNTEVDPNAKMPSLRRPTILDYIRQLPLGKRDHVKIALSATAYCAYQGEGAAVTVTNSVGTAAETTFPAQKIKARANGISREALLEDTASIVQKILADLRAQFYIFLENECLNGLGASGTTTAIWGIIPQFTTAFSGTTAGVHEQVVNPNYYDLANAMRLQAKVAPNNREYMPSVLCVAPSTAYLIKTAKDLDNKPLMLDGMLGGEFVVVENRTLTATEMVLIDPSVFEMYVGRNFEISIVQDTYPVTSGQTTTTYSDIDHDTYTMIAWFRGMLAMNLADKAGNIYVADIATALTDLAIPSGN